MLSLGWTSPVPWVTDWWMRVFHSARTVLARWTVAWLTPASRARFSLVKAPSVWMGAPSRSRFIASRSLSSVAWETGMSVVFLGPGAGDESHVGQSLVQCLAAGWRDARLAHPRCQVGFLGEPDRGVGGGDRGVAAAGGLAGSEQRGVAALLGWEVVLALGVGRVPEAVVDGAEVQVGELVAQQGDLGARVGGGCVQGRVTVDGRVDVVQSGVQARRCGSGGDDGAAAALMEEVYEAFRGGEFQLGVELCGPVGVDGRVAGGAAVGQGAAGGVFELQAQGDLGVGFLPGDDRHGAAEHGRPDVRGGYGCQAGAHVRPHMFRRTMSIITGQEPDAEIALGLQLKHAAR